MGRVTKPHAIMLSRAFFVGSDHWANHQRGNTMTRCKAVFFACVVFGIAFVIVPSMAAEYKRVGEVGKFGIYQADDRMTGLKNLAFTNSAFESDAEKAPQFEIFCSKTNNTMTLGFSMFTQLSTIKEVRGLAIYNVARPRLKFDSGKIESFSFDVESDNPQFMYVRHNRLPEFFEKIWVSNSSVLAISVNSANNGEIYSEFDLTGFEEVMTKAAEHCGLTLGKLNFPTQESSADSSDGSQYIANEVPGPRNSVIGEFIIYPGTVEIEVFQGTCFQFQTNNGPVKPISIQHKDGTWLSLREWKDRQISGDLAVKFKYEISTEVKVLRRAC